MEEEGVTVGYKEIYDELRSVSQSLVRLDGRMERIEEKFETVKEANERSRKAYNLADGATKDIDELERRFISYTERQEERADREKKHKLTMAGILVTVILFVLPMVIQYY
ncbi:hypothetical protein [Alteribacillus persepolensis]|nr:hypothetical protein [Alteribacillus persepolensis]